MRIPGGEGNRISRVSGCAGVLQATGDGDQLAASTRQVDEVEAESVR